MVLVYRWTVNQRVIRRVTYDSNRISSQKFLWCKRRKVSNNHQQIAHYHKRDTNENAKRKVPIKIHATEYSKRL